MTQTSRRKSSNKPSSGISPAVTQALEAAAHDIVFLPNPVQRQIKARFWARYEPVAGTHTIDAATIGQITNEPAISKWWSMPGFKEWFKNEDEARERLEYLFQLALDSAEALLLDPETNHNAKVQMIKTIGMLAGKEPTKSAPETRYLDAEIGKMDSARLKEYVRVQSLRLGEST